VSLAAYPGFPHELSLRTPEGEVEHGRHLLGVEPTGVEQQAVVERAVEEFDDDA
jgi:hypothetical protein